MSIQHTLHIGGSAGPSSSRASTIPDHDDTQAPQEDYMDTIAAKFRAGLGEAADLNLDVEDQDKQEKPKQASILGRMIQFRMHFRSLSALLRDFHFQVTRREQLGVRAVLQEESQDKMKNKGNGRGGHARGGRAARACRSQAQATKQYLTKMMTIAWQAPRSPRRTQSRTILGSGLRTRSMSGISGWLRGLTKPPVRRWSATRAMPLHQSEPRSGTPRRRRSPVPENRDKVDKPAKRKAAASDDSSDMEVVRKKTFARRFMPSSPVLKARWLATRSAFEDRILPKVTKFATHEASVRGFMYLATCMFVCFGKLLHLIAHTQVQYWNFCMSEWVEVDLDEDNAWDLATEYAQKYLSTIDSSTE